MAKYVAERDEAVAALRAVKGEEAAGILIQSAEIASAIEHLEKVVQTKDQEQ